MSTKQKKTSKREVVLATLTLVTTLLTVMGTATGLYFDWRAGQQTEQQAQQALKEAQEQKLRIQLENAKQSLLTCNLTPAERAEIDSVLTRASRELDIYSNIQSAQALLDSVHEKLVNCPIVTQTTPVVAPSMLPLGALWIGSVLVGALVSILFAVAWRSERRRKRLDPTAGVVSDQGPLVSSITTKHEVCRR